MSSATGSVTMWLEGARQGETRAAQQLWDRYVSALIRHAHAKLGKLDPLIGSEDVALMAFHSFLCDANTDRFPHLQDRDDLWQVLVMLTEECAIDEIRRANAKRRVPPDKVLREAEMQTDSGQETRDLGLAGIAGEEPTPVFAAEAAENLQRWLALLNSEQQQVALLKLAGYTNKEIAAQLGTALRSVERRLALIRRTWKEARRAEVDG